MTKDEIIARIDELEQAANALEEPEKTFKLCDIDQLKIQLQALQLEDIAEKLRAIALPDIGRMTADIATAKNATAAHSERVAAFDSAYALLKGALGIVV